MTRPDAVLLSYRNTKCGMKTNQRDQEGKEYLQQRVQVASVAKLVQTSREVSTYGNCYLTRYLKATVNTFT
jgi:hypothetical protein